MRAIPAVSDDVVKALTDWGQSLQASVDAAPDQPNEPVEGSLNDFLSRTIYILDQLGDTSLGEEVWAHMEAGRDMALFSAVGSRLRKAGWVRVSRRTWRAPFNGPVLDVPPSM